MADFAVGFSLLCLALATLAAWIAVQRGWVKATPPHPCLSFHELVLIQAQSLPAERVTLILKRCSRCGAHASFPTPGIWTIEELSRTESEISQLERMVK